MAGFTIEITGGGTLKNLEAMGYTLDDSTADFIQELDGVVIDKEYDVSFQFLFVQPAAFTIYDKSSSRPEMESFVFAKYAGEDSAAFAAEIEEGGYLDGTGFFIRGDFLMRIGLSDNKHEPISSVASDVQDQGLTDASVDDFLL